VTPALATFAAVALAFQPDQTQLRKLYENHVARCEREYGANDPRVAQAARDLGFFLKQEGAGLAAVPAFTKALRIDQTKIGATAP
jgi:hypothetical protein